MTKICNQCGAEIAPDAAFCTNCGAKVPEDEAVVQPQAKEVPLQEEQTPQAEVCSKCGSTLDPDAAFCTSCGTPRGAAPQPEPERQPQPAPQPQPQSQPQPQPQPQVQYVQETPRQQYAQPAPQYTQPQPVYSPPPQPAPQAPASIKPAEDKTNKVVSTGAYFWLMFLYSIPIIGFLVCLIMSFAPKNKNLKNFARAILIWMIIGLIIAALIVGAIYLIFDSIRDLVGESLGSLFDGLGLADLGEQFAGGLDNAPLD